MSTVSVFDTQSVRPYNKPELNTSAQVDFPRPFAAPPRLPHGIRELDIDQGANIRVKSTISNISKTSARYHIDSWANTIFHSGVSNSLNLAPANLEFQEGEHIRNLDVDLHAPASTRINFEHPFPFPPKVVVFFNLIDLDKNRNWRLSTSASGIDARGFTLSIETWGDTILHAARVGWIAYPEDKSHIFSTSVNTQEIRPSNKPQHKHSKAIVWENVEFWRNPDVFVALNMFDLGCGHNFRLRAYVDHVTQKGLTWHLDSWHDTVLYAAGVSIIAVN